jgi:RNA polymerase sigma factor (TIGR02999 family)
MVEITELIANAHRGDGDAADHLFAALYPELRVVARSRLRGTGHQIGIETTSLVHESFLRLVGSKSLKPESRAHFLAYASKVMRSVIVDLVREAQAERRGGGKKDFTLNTLVAESVAAETPDEEEVLFVHDALRRLYDIDQRMGQVVEMRYFGGLSDGEIGEALGVTQRTVGRDWEKARMFLHGMLKNQAC